MLRETNPRKARPTIDSGCFWGLGRRVDFTLNAIYERNSDLCLPVCFTKKKKKKTEQKIDFAE